MKKKFLAFTICVACSLSAFAQDISGSFKGLAHQRTALVELNFDDVSIYGMAEEDFAYYEPDWDKDKSTVVRKFVEELFDPLEDILLIKTSSKKPEYLIRVNVVDINSKGDFLYDVDIVNFDGQVEATVRSLVAYGGTFGSHLNLIKDGAEHAGEKLGRLLKREMRRALKHNR